MKLLAVLTLVLFFATTSSCQQIQPKEIIIATLDDSIKPVKISRKMPVPFEYYQLIWDDARVKGKARFLARDYFTFISSREVKVPANCYKFWYNKSGSMIRERWFYDTTEPSGTDFYYDNENRLIKYIVHSKTGMSDSALFIYDNNGLLRSKHNYKSGKIDEKRIINYDSLSRRCQEYQHGTYITSLSEKKYYYHRNTSELDSVVYNSGGKAYYVYGNGLVKSISTYYPDGKYSKSEFKYNDSGDVIWELKNFSDQVYTYQYIYDKQGNWIRKLASINGEPQNLVLRTIEYY